MARILITSGPTRQYLDPVRFLSNASSGTMGRELAQAAIHHGHEVVIVSGPVSVTYPSEATVVHVVTTEQMREAAAQAFVTCDGVIGAAAPCDYKSKHVAEGKIKKTGQTLTIELVETADIMQQLGQSKTALQWSVGFALETESDEKAAIKNATEKLERKHCDLIVLNGAAAIESANNSIRIIDHNGTVGKQFEGSKAAAAAVIIAAIEDWLVESPSDGI